MRDAVKATIENAVEVLATLKQDRRPLEREIERHAREVTAAAGGHAAFIAWADQHPNWRFNLAEAPNALHGQPPALADYVARSILVELLDRQPASDVRAGRR